MRVTTSTRIDAPPEQVFDALADLRNDPQWNSRITSAELRSPEPIGRGSQFAIVNGGNPYDVTVATHDRPSRLVLEAHGKPDLTIAASGARADGGTELHSEFTFHTNGLQTLVFAVAGPLIRREIPKQLTSLKGF